MARLGREWLEALRAAGRAPAHAVTCVALLAIGVASPTAILAVGDALFRQPLPVRDEAGLIVPYGTRGADERVSASAIELEAWRGAAAFDGLAAALPQAVTLDRDGEPERLRGARVEAGYFPLLGVAPALGRAFDEAETQAEARLVLLGFGLWQRRFGGDPAVLGQALRLDGEEWVVIGVMPRGFDLPIGSEVWSPLHIAGLPPERRGNQVYDPVARLAPGRSLDDARADLARIGRRLEEERPDTNAGWGVGAITLRRNLLDDPHGTVERAVGLTFWGAGLLLLIACANVAQLQLVRSVGRLGELGVRLSLGASRAALARTLVFEGLVLAFLAAAASVPLSLLLAQGLVRLGPVSATAFSAQLSHVSLEPWHIGLALAAALATGLAAGVYPAARVARGDVSALLRGEGRSSSDPGRRHVLEGAVLVQVAVTVALLCTTLALAESYALLRGLDVGFRPEGVSYYTLSLSPREHADRERRAAFAEAVVQGLRGLDGVSAAGFTTNVPLSSPAVNWIAGYGCEGRELAPGEQRVTADRLVGPGYLETLGVTLLAGRTLDDRDVAGREPVAVINRTLAEECWPGGEAVGRSVLRMRRSGPLPMRVVGVVADAQEQRVSFGAPHAAWYLPYRQHDQVRDLYLVARGDAPAPQVREIVRRLDPHQPVSSPRPLTAHLEEIVGSDRMAALVMGYFAALGLALVGVGIHGSAGRFVAEQRRAIGTRMAFGAAPGRIAWSVVGRGLALAGGGAAVGAAGALALQQVTAAFAYGALLGVPMRLGATAAVVVALSALACAGPALRAARVDPARLLRGE